MPTPPPAASILWDQNYQPPESTGKGHLDDVNAQEGHVYSLGQAEIAEAQRQFEARRSGQASIANYQQQMGTGSLQRQAMGAGAGSALAQRQAMNMQAGQGSQMLGQMAGARAQEMAEARKAQMGAYAHMTAQELEQLRMAAERAEAQRQTELQKQQAGMAKQAGTYESALGTAGAISGAAGGVAASYSGSNS